MALKQSSGPKETREQAWQRLLRQLEARQSYVNKIAEQDRQEQMGMEASERNELLKQEKMAPGESAVRGGQMGMTAGGPWGALIGAVAGKGLGAIEYGKKHGFWEGLGRFADPFVTTKALLTTPEGQQRGASMAGAFGKTQARGETAQRAPAGLEAGREMESMRPGSMSTEGMRPGWHSIDQYGPDQGTARFTFGEKERVSDEDIARSEALDAAIEEERRKKLANR